MDPAEPARCFGVAPPAPPNAGHGACVTVEDDAEDAIILLERVKPAIVREPAFVKRARDAIDDEGFIAEPATRPTKWLDYELLGLPHPKPQRPQGMTAQLVVSAYRLLGFAILTIIVVVLVGYIATTGFYYLNTTWVTPVALSPSDDKVVALRAQLAAQQNVRDRLAADLEETERAIAAQQAFQSQFVKAIRSDLQGRQAALGRARALADQAQTTRLAIRSTNDQYATEHADRMAKEYDAGLIDRTTMLTGRYQLAQVATSNLSLTERQTEFEQRAAQLAVEARALDTLLSNRPGTAPLSYDVLKIKRDYDASRLELERAIANRKLLQTSLGRQDEILRDLRGSAYLRVIANQATVAQVPYDNLANVTAGTKLYACKLKMVWCREVGSVVALLPGEVTFRHPQREATVRGQLVELKLDDPGAAANAVLFLGRKPLWL